MSNSTFKDFIVLTEKKDINYKQSTIEAIKMLQQAANWLDGKGVRPSSKNQDAKEIIAKALAFIGKLDVENVEETAPEPEAEETTDTTEEKLE